jgi:hypothetical protein
MPFVKLDCQALDSTLWVLRPDREVFLTALLMAEPWEFKEPQLALRYDSLDPSGFIVPPGWYGFVQASGPGIVRRAIVDDQEGKKALKRLSEPEEESRSHDFEGRRMVRIDGGYVILNFQKFRDRDYSAADRMRRWRERRNEGVTRNVTPVTRNVTQAEAEGEAEGKAKHTHTCSPEVSEVYDLYPRKQGRKAAIKAIENALKSKTAYQLKEATTAYAKAVAAWPAERWQFVPHPSSWFNKGCYDDDRQTWIYVDKNGIEKKPQKTDAQRAAERAAEIAAIPEQYERDRLKGLAEGR